MNKKNERAATAVIGEVLASLDPVPDRTQDPVVSEHRTRYEHFLSFAFGKLKAGLIRLDAGDLIPCRPEFLILDAVLVNADSISLLHYPPDQREDINDQKCGRQEEIANVLPDVKGDQHRQKEKKRHHRHNRGPLEKNGRGCMCADQLAEIFFEFCQDRLSLTVRARRVDHRLDLGDTVGRKAAFAGMFLDQVLVRSRVNTVDLIVGHIAVYPLDLSPKAIQNTARLLRRSHKIIRRHFTGTGNITFYHEFGHLGFLQSV